MDLVRQIIAAEAAFPRSFTNVVDRPWGVMYCLPEIRDSHDSNHAWAFSGEPGEVIAEVEAFYREKGVASRLRWAPLPDQPDPFRPALEAKGYSIEAHLDQVFIHADPSTIAPNETVQVRRVHEVAQEWLDRVERTANLRAKNVLAHRIEAKDYHLLVGYVDARPVTMASLQDLGELTRVDDVLTDVDHRGRGYGRAVIHALVGYHAEHMGNTLYLYADNPTAIRIYAEAGFVRIEDRAVSYSAWKD